MSISSDCWDQLCWLSRFVSVRPKACLTKPVLIAGPAHEHHRGHRHRRRAPEGQERDQEMLAGQGDVHGLRGVREVRGADPRLSRGRLLGRLDE